MEESSILAFFSSTVNIIGSPLVVKYSRMSQVSQVGRGGTSFYISTLNFLNQQEVGKVQSLEALYGKDQDFPI